MKKLFLLCSAIFIATICQAQISLAKPDGTSISDGQIFTYNTTAEATATFKYKIINSSATATNVKIRVVSITNADGSNVQFCYPPTCLFSITAGSSYPPTSAINISANSETPSTGLNFWNNNTGDGVNYPIDYVFKFYQINAFGSEIGNSVTITYRYNPNAMGVSDLQSLDSNFLQVNTQITDVATVKVADNAQYKIYGLNGALISKGKLSKGINTIEASNLTSGIYMIQVNDENGKTITKKLRK